jgi:hypothetical protein
MRNVGAAGRQESDDGGWKMEDGKDMVLEDGIGGQAPNSPAPKIRVNSRQFADQEHPIKPPMPPPNRAS